MTGLPGPLPLNRESRRAAVRIAGVYVVFGPRGTYVGESANIPERLAYMIACGFDWTIISYMKGATRKQRQSEERRIITAYRRAGLRVVSRTNGEASTLSLMRLTAEQRRARARIGWEARQVTSEQQAEYGRKSGGGARLRALSAERRREISRMGTAARWPKRAAE